MVYDTDQPRERLSIESYQDLIKYLFKVYSGWSLHLDKDVWHIFLVCFSMFLDMYRSHTSNTNLGSSLTLAHIKQQDGKNRACWCVSVRVKETDWTGHLFLLCPVISQCNSDKCQTASRPAMSSDKRLPTASLAPHRGLCPPTPPSLIPNSDSVSKWREFVPPTWWTRYSAPPEDQHVPSIVCKTSLSVRIKAF